MAVLDVSTEQKDTGERDLLSECVLLSSLTLSRNGMLSITQLFSFDRACFSYLIDYHVWLGP